MINRVTHLTVQRSTLANLQVNLTKMSDLQGRLSGGKVITKPSDDPAGTASVLSLRADKRANEQYSRNAADGVGWLSTVDTALQNAAANVRQARDLTVKGANTGAASQATRDAIATELRGVRDAMLDQANATYLGRSVFAGTANGPAYDATTYDWANASRPTDEVLRRVGPSTQIRADADGSKAFGSGTTSVFALIDKIASDIQNGTGDVSARIGELDMALNAVLGELAGVGTRYKQLTTAQSTIESAVTDLKGQISDIEDIDLAETLIELQSQEVAYQAALGATSRVLQPSLLDFLR